jgi:hypothetical protein
MAIQPSWNAYARARTRKPLAAFCRPQLAGYSSKPREGGYASRQGRLTLDRLRRAWAETDQGRALDQLRVLAGDLERSHPGAAASLREGMEETLTLTRLGIRGNLKKTLESPSACESMIEWCGARPATSSAGSRATWACAGPPPACSRRSASSGASSASPIRQARHRYRARARSVHRPDADRGGRNRRNRLSVTPGPP